MTSSFEETLLRTGLDGLIGDGQTGTFQGLMIWTGSSTFVETVDVVSDHIQGVCAWSGLTSMTINTHTLFVNSFMLEFLS